MRRPQRRRSLTAVRNGTASNIVSTLPVSVTLKWLGVEQAVAVTGHGEVGRVEPVGDHRILARRDSRILREKLLEGLLRRDDDVIRALDHPALERVLEAPAHAAALIGLLSPDALSPRVAEIGDPRDVGGALEHEPEHLAGVRRRARIDDRGSLLADERHALEEGARHPRDLRVGNQDVGLHEPGGPLEHAAAGRPAGARTRHPSRARAGVRPHAGRSSPQLRGRASQTRRCACHAPSRMGGSPRGASGPEAASRGCSRFVRSEASPAAAGT